MGCRSKSDSPTRQAALEAGGGRRAARARRRGGTCRAARPATARRGAAGTARRGAGPSPWSSSSRAISSALDRLADADVVGDQQPHRVEPAAPSAAARAGTGAARRRCGRTSGTGRRWSGSPSRSASRSRRAERVVAEVGRDRAGRTWPASTGSSGGEDAGDLVVGAAERAQHEQRRRRTRAARPTRGRGPGRASRRRSSLSRLPEHVGRGADDLRPSRRRGAKRTTVQPSCLHQLLSARRRGPGVRGSRGAGRRRRRRRSRSS